MRGGADIIGQNLIAQEGGIEIGAPRVGGSGQNLIAQKRERGFELRALRLHRVERRKASPETFISNFRQELCQQQ
jgi:hypothetical protein